MLLTPQDVELFFRFHRALMFFVNQRLKVLPDDVASPDEFSSLSPEMRLKVRDAFLGHTDLIRYFFNVASGGHGFLRDKGIYTELDVPGATSTAANGINNFGQIVGNFFDAGSGVAHGFLLHNGIYTEVS